MAPKTTRCSVPSCEKTVFTLPFFLIPTLEKSGLTLFLMKTHTMSVRTFDAQFDAGFSERWKVKGDAVPTILDPTVMSHYTSVSNCFYYVVTIALSVITDCLICMECFCIFNLNHSSIHLLGMHAVKHTQLLANRCSGHLLLNLQSTPIQIVL